MSVSATRMPFSPVMTVMRSLNGVSQFTMCEAMVPSLRRADGEHHVLVRRGRCGARVRALTETYSAARPTR